MKDSEKKKILVVIAIVILFAIFGNSYKSEPKGIFEFHIKYLTYTDEVGVHSGSTYEATKVRDYQEQYLQIEDGIFLIPLTLVTCNGFKVQLGNFLQRYDLDDVGNPIQNEGDKYNEEKSCQGVKTKLLENNGFQDGKQSYYSCTGLRVIQKSYCIY